MLDTFTATVTLMPKREEYPDSDVSIVLTHPMWGQNRKLLRPGVLKCIVDEAGPFVADQIDDLIMPKGYCVEARHGDVLVHTDGVTWLFTYDVEIGRYKS